MEDILIQTCPLVTSPLVEEVAVVEEGAATAALTTELITTGMVAGPIHLTVVRGLLIMAVTINK
jgi:hypothetical protein